MLARAQAVRARGSLQAGVSGQVVAAQHVQAIHSLQHLKVAEGEAEQRVQEELGAPCQAS